jgi:hypothetical protein
MSSTLWAHLLNKDAAASGSGLKAGLTSSGLAAMAPADRTGTSVRILLHDTQATIEKFSERVDKLVSEAEDSRQRLLTRNEEVSGEMEQFVRRAVQEHGTSLLLLLQIALEAPPPPNPGPVGHIRLKLCAYIDRIFSLTLGYQWAERKLLSSHIFGSLPKLLLLPNYDSPSQVRWMRWIKKSKLFKTYVL